MPSPNQIKVQAGDNLLLVGTMKGAFLFRGDASRDRWEEAGPYFPGRSVYALTYDGRNGRNRLWAAVNSPYWGSFLSSSNDFVPPSMMKPSGAGMAFTPFFCAQ